MKKYLLKFPEKKYQSISVQVTWWWLLELLQFSLPEKWQVAMILQDFDPVEHSLREFVAFCTRIEMAYDGTSKEGHKKSDTESA